MVDTREGTTEEHRAGTSDGKAAALEATGVYEIGTGVVLYDTEEPLAWVQADNAVELDDAV